MTNKWTKDTVIKYLQNWASKLNDEQESTLPSIKRSGRKSTRSIHLASPKPRRKIDFVKKNKKMIMNPQWEVKRRTSDVLNFQKHMLSTIQNPNPPLKRNSANILSHLTPLTQEERKWEVTHAYMIENCKEVVQHAKDARFAAFSSPRILRIKADSILKSRNWFRKKSIGRFINTQTSSTPYNVSQKLSELQIDDRGQLRQFSDEGEHVPYFYKRCFSPQPLSEKRV